MTQAARDTATFVLCIEDNAIRAQALLLCESIRRFGGCHRHARIVAVSPRPGLRIDRETRRTLEAMSVEYVELVVGLPCPEYGSANRVFAAAWAEGHGDSEWLVVLDSDTIFLDEPALPDNADVAVRPVDTKGATTEGPGDPFEAYWTSLAGLHGVSIDCLPFVTTTDGGHRVRASYNGGLVAVRRNLGILTAWADLFTRSANAGLKPLRDSGVDVHASTGFVGREASEYWGSNQAALAFVIWKSTKRVCLYPETYNVPLHMVIDQPHLRTRRQSPIVHVHYHWVFTEPHYRAALAALEDIGTAGDGLDWLAARLPIPPAATTKRPQR
jgi:hypothetical protein